jgi:hypothetical protein
MIKTKKSRLAMMIAILGFKSRWYCWSFSVMVDN